MSTESDLTARDSLSNRLARSVLRLISEEGLELGAKLPSVRELSERFAVAVPTMREALSLLQLAGHVEMRHGSGVYVRNVKPRLMLANPYSSELDAAGILQLLRARLLIEPRVAALAAQVGSDEAFDTLQGVLTEAEARLSGGEADEGLLSANMRFHRGIADASGNRFLAEVVHTLTEVRVKEQLVVLDLYDDRQRDHEQHIGILAALRSRDPRAANDAVHDHLAEVAAVVETRLGKA